LRAALLLACGLVAAPLLADDTTPTLQEISASSPAALEASLARLRGRPDADAVLRSLKTELATRADLRREAGQPPLFAGCMSPEEFELGAQLSMAHAAADGATYRALAAEYLRLTSMLRNALGAAQSSGNWRKHFSHLGRWITDWSRARDPRVRELLRRTLVDQAIRASLSAYHGNKVYFMARPTPALRAYDEYLFNLMCTSDEDNLDWLKDEVARHGWFDIGRYGRAADQAAWLMVQHADGAPAYQAYIAAVLEVKARSGDTNPQNFAFLSDRVAVRSGRPQTFATQMECVAGQWIEPEVVAPETLNERRASLGLPPYEKQLAARKNLACEKTPRR
jgi:hypothetical protein